MMEAKKLAKLFESASEFGKDSIQVKLETRPIFHNSEMMSEDTADDIDTSSSSGDGGMDKEPTQHDTKADSELLEALPYDMVYGPKIENLIVFPHLSRNNNDPQHRRKYVRLLDSVMDHDVPMDEVRQITRELFADFAEKKFMENSVVCQVLIPCIETFWVKDLETGKLLQGDYAEKAVVHLVRFEQITKTHIVRSDDSSRSRFKTELGEWKITDIDDLCGGNLIL